MEVGQPLPEHVVDVRPEPMKVVAALLRDPNMIHLDPDVTAALGMGRRVVNQAPLNIGYIHTMLEAFGSVRSSSFRLLGNVVAGDRVVAGGRVVAVDGDLVTCEVWLDVVGGVRAVSGTAVVCLGR